jgi:hypothetical protein
VPTDTRGRGAPDGADIDDDAAGTAEGAGGVFAGEQQAADVDNENSVDMRRIDGGQRIAGGNAGVVHQDIQPSEILHGEIHQGRDLGLDGDIGLKSGSLAAGRDDFRA